MWDGMDKGDLVSLQMQTATDVVKLYRVYPIELLLALSFCSQFDR